MNETVTETAEETADEVGNEAAASSAGAEVAESTESSALIFAHPNTALLDIFRSAAQTPGSPVRWPARLFRAGAFPEKGVTITRDDLDGVIEHFRRDTDRGAIIPVKVEHQDSPLDPLGAVIALWREDETLYAMLSFSPHMALHLLERDALHLSAAFHQMSGNGAEGRLRLAEASLVGHPRIADARLLHRHTVAFHTENTAASPAANTANTANNAAEAFLRPFREAGKVTPAMEPPLCRLLAATVAPTFAPAFGPTLLQFHEASPTADGTAEISGMRIQTELRALLDAMPPVLPRGATVPATVRGTEPVYDATVLRMAERLGVAAEKLVE
jgi:hypothetical protein